MATALILPHPALTGAQLQRLREREGLDIQHLGNAIFRLVQTSAPRHAGLRIARPDDHRPDPEAA